MHYRNGRKAEQGDKVINLESGASGLVYALSGQSATCNGRLAPVSNNDAYVTLLNCVHVDDVSAAFPPPAKPAAG